MPGKEDLFDKFDLALAKIGASKSSLFNILDEFTVYCYYIEEKIPNIQIEVGKNINSPLRDGDLKASFRLYYRHSKLVFTDYGDNNKTGDIVFFIMELFSITEKEALKKIAYDFGLSDNKVNTILPVRQQIIKKKKELGIKTKPFTNSGLSFWNSFHISLSTLKKFNVFEVDIVFWDNYPIKPKELTFAYRIGKYWKVYSPLEIQHKFITNYPRNYVEGLLSMPSFGELLIVTKSLKDSLVLYELGYWSISPKSESTLISEQILKKLDLRFKKIIVFFDNDLRHNAHLYPYPLIMLPLPGPKDISDFVKANGLYRGRKIMAKLLKI